MHSIATPLLSKALDVSRTENDSRVDGFNDVLCSTPKHVLMIPENHQEMISYDVF
jgi:hypothetical protein